MHTHMQGLRLQLKNGSQLVLVKIMTDIYAYGNTTEVSKGSDSLPQNTPPPPTHPRILFQAIIDIGMTHMTSKYWDSKSRSKTNSIYKFSSHVHLLKLIMDVYSNIYGKASVSSQSWKEGNVLFNDALNTFYLLLYGVGHMVKYHSDSERKPAAATWAILSD